MRPLVTTDSKSILKAQKIVGNVYGAGCFDFFLLTIFKSG